jgi:amino acid permease
MALVSCMSIHCMLLLVECKTRLKGHGVVSFSDVAAFTCGRRVATITDCLLVFTQFGFSVVYLVFVSDNVLHYFPNVPRESGRLYVLMLLYPFFVAMAWIRTLHLVSLASAVANVAIVLGMLVVLIASSLQIQHSVLPGQTATADLGVRWSTLPIMAGVAIYAFEGIGVVLPSETAMKRPQKFPSVLLSVLIISTFIYMMFGSVPYLAFGEETGKANGQITDNLQEFAMQAPDHETWLVLREVLRVCLCLGIALAYPVQLFVATDILEVWLFNSNNNNSAVGAATSTAGTGVGVTSAAASPVRKDGYVPTRDIDDDDYDDDDDGDGGDNKNNRGIGHSSSNSNINNNSSNINTTSNSSSDSNDTSDGNPFGFPLPHWSSLVRSDRIRYWRGVLASQWRAFGRACCGKAGLSRIWKENLFRAALVFFGCFVAVTIPKFGPLMGIIGSFGCSALQFILPPLFFLRLPGFARPPIRSRVRTLFLLSYIVVGVVFGISGTVQSLNEAFTGDA